MLPKQGQHLIIGGPGTGKSVLALLRARRHDREGDDYVFLVYNKLLDRASQQLFGTKLVSRTWFSWFGTLYFRLTSRRLPLQPGDGPFPPIDWEAVASILDSTEVSSDIAWPYLIIDEGQDMPPAFYETLIQLGFENFFVVADQNQQIVSGQNSNRSDIERVLGLNSEDVIELRRNYRNEYAVARLARELCDPDPASPAPELPVPSVSARAPILYSYEGRRFDDVIARILKMADSNPRILIGVIAPNNKVRERYLDALRSSAVSLDHGRPQISTYYSGAPLDVSFEQCGIVVINAQSCKGLEFHAVILADIHGYRYRHGDTQHTRNLFYVMVARARRIVILLKDSSRFCPVTPLLPTDNRILEWRP